MRVRCFAGEPLRELGLKPRARFHSFAVCGVEDYLVSVTASLDHANALAARPASELGPPTWGPPCRPGVVRG